MSVSEPEDLRTPLHLACATGNLAMAQLLIWVRFSLAENTFCSLLLRRACNNMSCNVTLETFFAA